MVLDQLSDSQLNDSDADRVFQALADGTRRDILVRVIRDEQSVSALARHYPISLTAVQKHVGVLERAALVSKQRRGREQVVRADPAVLRRAARLLDEYELLWRHRAAAIETLLAGNDRGDTNP
jgi:DNA-binding transcriptional ArsR family regulator